MGKLIFTAIVISLVFGAIMTYLIAEIIKHKEMQSQLKESHDRLFIAYEALSSTEEEMKYLAHHDYLTGLPNRIKFMQELTAEMAKNNPLAIILLDIDNFKEINDTLGHIYGDKILQEIAGRLLDCSCYKVFVSRFGGDEFLIYMPDDGDNVVKCVEMIHSKFMEPIVIDEQENHIRVSLGITRFPADSRDINKLIMNADTAMYKVKQRGKNGYLFYNREMQEEIKIKAEINSVLKKAVYEDGFYLVYQPQINSATFAIDCFEALLRLKGDSHCSISQYINVAEESELIVHIGRTVTQKTVQQIALWQEAGFRGKKVSFNLSSKQVRDKGYLSFLAKTLKQYNVKPENLEVEITENILLSESEENLNFIMGLRNLGLSIALDDFGTGYSSLKYLTYIPVDKIKLDKSLLNKFLSMRNYKVIKSIIDLAHSLNLTITAEGVETVRQFELLKENNCDFIQGYLFSKPQDAEKIPEIYYNNFENIFLNKNIF